MSTMNEQSGKERIDESLRLRQNELVQKRTRLQVCIDLWQATSRDVETKSELLKEETKKLDKLQHTVWSLQNRMCDEVWSFTKNHDLATIFNAFPQLPSEYSLRCGCNDKGSEGGKQAEMQNMSLEIEALELDLEHEKYNEMKDDLKKAEQELQECSKKSSEIQSLENDIEACKKRIQSLRAQVTTTGEGSQRTNLENKPLFGNNSGGLQTTANTCTVLPLKSTTRLNGNFKRKLTDANDNEDALTFVKASAYMKRLENSSDYQGLTTKTLSCGSEKSAPAVATVQPRKKFVCKTKSNITKKLSR